MQPYQLTHNAIVINEISYPFNAPPDFATWLKTKQDAFVAGVLHVYTGGNNPTPQTAPQPTQEQQL